MAVYAVLSINICDCFILERVLSVSMHVCVHMSGVGLMREGKGLKVCCDI